MIRFQVRSGGQTREFSTDERVITFGRSHDNTVPVEDPKSSRQHCRIELSPSGWKLVDLESENGTAVNGEVVNVRVLKDGDVIRIGEFEATFNPPVAAVRVAAAPAKVAVPPVKVAAPPHAHVSPAAHVASSVAVAEP
ncbi:MAG: FHA domain-containing protein, partial [Planctomycetes bacterium]|nr:FHA domain-containing protein [Planctomycetota bacterium]